MIGPLQVFQQGLYVLIVHVFGLTERIHHEKVLLSGLCDGLAYKESRPAPGLSPSFCRDNGYALCVACDEIILKVCEGKFNFVCHICALTRTLP